MIVTACERCPCAHFDGKLYCGHPGGEARSLPHLRAGGAVVTWPIPSWCPLRVAPLTIEVAKAATCRICDELATQRIQTWVDGVLAERLRAREALVQRLVEAAEAMLLLHCDGQGSVDWTGCPDEPQHVTLRAALDALGRAEPLQAARTTNDAINAEVVAGSAPAPCGCEEADVCACDSADTPCLSCEAAVNAEVDAPPRDGECEDVSDEMVRDFVAEIATLRRELRDADRDRDAAVAGLMDERDAARRERDEALAQLDGMPWCVGCQEALTATERESIRARTPASEGAQDSGAEGAAAGPHGQRVEDATVPSQRSDSRSSASGSWPDAYKDSTVHELADSHRACEVEDNVSFMEVGYCEDCCYWREEPSQAGLGSTARVGLCLRFTDNLHGYGKVIIVPAEDPTRAVRFETAPNFGCEAFEDRS